MSKRAEDRFAWTPALVQDLRDMWSDGKTSGEISRELGASRGSVMSKVRRLDLARRPKRAPMPVTEGPGRGAAMKEWWERFWTPGRTAVVVRGYTPETVMQVSRIAATIGCSMTSVSRKAKELKLQHPTMAAHTRNLQAAEGRIYRHPATSKDSRNVPLNQVASDECRFPVTPHNAEKHLFCGAKTEGLTRSFCPFHHAIAYFKPDAKKEAA